MEMTSRIIGGDTQVRVEVSEPGDVGECRRTAKRLAEAHGFDEAGASRIGIVATELATNVVRHGGGGEVLVQLLDDGVTPQVEMLAIDRGRGMRDVADCLRDGYSTGGTPGTGLGAVSRLSSTFDIFSALGRGTVVLSRVARKSATASRRAAPSPLEFGAICVAVAGEIECGDTWRIADGGATIALLVTDGLGHGSPAAAASRAAALAFSGRPFDEPSEAMQHLHRSLLGGRGAVAACAQLHAGQARIDYAGIGNISGTIVEPERSRGMVSYNGTLGAQLSRTRQFAYDWPPNSLVVMHSDGLSARWSLANYPGLHARHAAVIAAVLYRESARKRDDATVLVVRFRQ
jgi:anti-sigma regulatory factor (Ser/Thr protein kinase)